MNKPFPFWQDLRKLLVDRQDGTFAERVEAYPPAKLMTDGDGDNARLRVDVAQTGFFAGREAFTFIRFDIPADTTQIIKVVAPINTIVQLFGASLILAGLDIELVQGGTEGGTFGTPLPILKTNQMSTAPAYSPQVTMATGGTHTGGTILNAIQLLAGTPANQAIEQVVTNELPFGFPAGTYYIRLVNTNGANAKGIFRARWEERP
jgi:hypothetical protein